MTNDNSSIIPDTGVGAIIQGGDEDAQGHIISQTSDIISESPGIAIDNEDTEGHWIIERPGIEI